MSDIEKVRETLTDGMSRVGPVYRDRFGHALDALSSLEAQLAEAEKFRALNYAAMNAEEKLRLASQAREEELRAALERLYRCMKKSGPMGRIADLAIGGADAMDEAQAALAPALAEPETPKMCPTCKSDDPAEALRLMWVEDDDLDPSTWTFCTDAFHAATQETTPKEGD